MNKLTTLPLLIFCFIVSTSCNRPRVPEFDGIKVDGSLDNFVKMMLKKGYVKEEAILPVRDTEPPTFVTFKGNSQHPDIEVIVCATQKTKLVYFVAAGLPPTRPLDTVREVKRYDSTLKSLTEKYGQPTRYAKGMRRPVIFTEVDNFTDTVPLVTDEELQFSKKYLVWSDKGITAQLDGWTTAVYYENYTNVDIEKKRVEKRKKKVF